MNLNGCNQENVGQFTKTHLRKMNQDAVFFAPKGRFKNI